MTLHALLAAVAAGDAAIGILFMELGGALIVLGILARAAGRFELSPVPFYLAFGVLLGGSGILPIGLSRDFIEVGAEIGVILLLFMVGLEYTANELRSSLTVGLPSGFLDLILNMTPGVAAGLLLGWSPVAALLLGGVTYISSSGIIAKVLGDLDRLGNRETPSILTILVLEDLAMAFYLPLVAVLLLGTGLAAGVVSLGIALATVALALVLAMRMGAQVSRLIANRSSEVLLLSVLGLIFLVSGGAQVLQVSAAVGAFLVGIALSGEVAHRTRGLLAPLRDLFAAIFFLFFGLQIDPASLTPMLVPALLLAVVTAATKAYTGWWAARRAGVGARGRLRAAVTLIARGEFSIVIAELGVVAGVAADLGPLAACYVLILAMVGPLLTKVADPLAGRWLAGRAVG